MRIEPGPLQSANGAVSARPREIAGVPAVAPRPGTVFETLLGRRQASARKSLQAIAEQASGPQALDPALFSTPRALELLGHILEQLLPSLDLDPDIRVLAEDLIREEIHMRHWLEQQRGEAAL